MHAWLGLKKILNKGCLLIVNYHFVLKFEYLSFIYFLFLLLIVCCNNHWIYLTECKKKELEFSVIYIVIIYTNFVLDKVNKFEIP